jgi:hypothetical protein
MFNYILKKLKQSIINTLTILIELPLMIIGIGIFLGLLALPFIIIVSILGAVIH